MCVFPITGSTKQCDQAFYDGAAAGPSRSLIGHGHVTHQFDPFSPPSDCFPPLVRNVPVPPSGRSAGKSSQRNSSDCLAPPIPSFGQRQKPCECLLSRADDTVLALLPSSRHARRGHCPAASTPNPHAFIVISRSTFFAWLVVDSLNPESQSTPPPTFP